MKKKQTIRGSGNALEKESGQQERALPQGAEEALEADEQARRLKLMEIQDKIASGRYKVSSKEVARSMIQHLAEDEADQAKSTVRTSKPKISTTESRPNRSSSKK